MKRSAVAVEPTRRDTFADARDKAEPAADGRIVSPEIPEAKPDMLLRAEPRATEGTEEGTSTNTASISAWRRDAEVNGDRGVRGRRGAGVRREADMMDTK